MGNSALDPLALAVAAAVALLIVVVLALAHRDDHTRRGWITAVALFVGLAALGVVDLARYSPRETKFTIVLLGVALPVFGTLGSVRATQRMRPWLRWLVLYLVALVLVFGGFLLGAVLSRWLPF